MECDQRTHRTKESMNSISFELIQPQISDAELALSWRNDPTTMQMSFTHVTVESIEKFFPKFLKSYFAFADLPSVFALMNGKKIAVLRFDSAEDPKDHMRKSAEVSINLAPEWRGKGFGTQILRQIKNWAAAQGYQTLIAKIKTKNLASIKTFQNADFKLFKKKLWQIEGRQEEVEVYLAELATGSEPRVYVIAEAGSNWHAETIQKGLTRAYELIDAAKKAGADAIKFQLFNSDTLYVKEAGQSEYLAKAGMEKDINLLIKELELPSEVIPLLADKCQKSGIDFLATAFSEEEFAFLNPFVKMHKIASYEISHIRLLECAARSGKPLLLSTGASTIEDVDWAVDTFKNLGGKELTLLQCTAKYPAPAGSLNLRVLPWFKRRYKVNVGLSDHSLNPFAAPLAALAMGATVIEKHFTLSRKLKGPDHLFAIEPEELTKMVQALREEELMFGTNFKTVGEEELELYAFARRGIQALHNIQSGEILKEGENVAILRPGKKKCGMHPKFLEKMEGREANRAIPAGDGVQLSDF